MNYKLLLISIISHFTLNAQINSILQFQKDLIVNKKTGSNIALVYKENEVVYKEIANSGAIGDKDINDSTIFPIWSMSKPITVVSVMTLYEKGLIEFEDPVSKYIPEFEDLKCKNDDEVYPCNNELTILHLLTHRSGYSYYGNPEFFTSTIKYDNLNDFISDVADYPVEFEPGSDYIYGINQAILGRLVEVVSGKSFYEYLKEVIFDPLEMNNTKFYLTKKDREYFQPLFINDGKLIGYTNYLDELSYDENNRAYFGGEGLVSTLSDYSNFCKMLLNNGIYNGRRIISKSSIKLMTNNYTQLEYNPFHYGFSLFVLNNSRFDGTNSPNGIYGWSGYHNTHFWIDPKNELFVIFLSRAREFSFEMQQELRRSVYSTF